MKKSAIILLLIFTLFCISCTQTDVTNSDFEASTYSPLGKLTSLTQAEALAETIVYEPNTNPIDGYTDYYLGIDTLPEGVTEYLYFTSATTAVSETGIFKVTDKETADKLTEAFKARGENLASVFSNYSPEDTAIAQNLETGSFDDIVWFTATKDNGAVKAIITE